jgi:hypothetical protein
MSQLAASTTPKRSVVSRSVWVGRGLSSLVILFLAIDAAMKIAALPIVAETARTIGWTTDPGFWRAIGLLLLAMTALYPRSGSWMIAYAARIGGICRDGSTGTGNSCSPAG